jgi:hypothetical protein
MPLIYFLFVTHRYIILHKSIFAAFFLDETDVTETWMLNILCLVSGGRLRVSHRYLKLKQIISCEAIESVNNVTIQK